MFYIKDIVFNDKVPEMTNVAWLNFENGEFVLRIFINGEWTIVNNAENIY